jgi:hypothetical protein
VGITGQKIIQPREILVLAGHDDAVPEAKIPLL